MFREGKDIARCTVERLMREHGLHGVTRGQNRTTIHDPAPDPAQACPDDRVNREFTATAPKTSSGCRTSPACRAGWEWSM